MQGLNQREMRVERLEDVKRICEIEMVNAIQNPPQVPEVIRKG